MLLLFIFIIFVFQYDQLYWGTLFLRQEIIKQHDQIYSPILDKVSTLYIQKTIIKKLRFLAPETQSTNMIELYNISFITSNDIFNINQDNKIIYSLKLSNVSNSQNEKKNQSQTLNKQMNPEQRKYLLQIPLKVRAKNILESQNQIKYHISSKNNLPNLKKVLSQKYDFTIVKNQVDIVCEGLINMEDHSINYSSWTGKKQLESIGFLSANYLIYDSRKQLVNEVLEAIDLSIFSFKINFFVELPFKRAYIILKTGDDQDQSLRLPLKSIQKNWLWYNDIFHMAVAKKRSKQAITISIFSYDYPTDTKELFAIGKFNFYLDFQKNSEIKIFQSQIELFKENDDPNNLSISNGLGDSIANIQFKYCRKTEKNTKIINKMTSKIYVENSFSPYQFSPRILQNSTVLKSPHQSNNHSTTFANNSFLFSSQTSEMSPFRQNSASPAKKFIHILPKSKFHSIISRNSTIAIDKAQRFPTTKKITNQLGYYAHKTLDINQLPKSERYRYASFGKDSKNCLKQSRLVGPGSGGYRLPSIFDKYQ